MGRVKLEVTADASSAIEQMTKLSQSIKTAMSGFDSKGIDTWSGSVAKAITSINDRFSDIQKKIESLNKTFETKVTYGGTESLTTFKENLKVVKEALSDFSKVFSTSMTFGANDSVIKFQANIQKADEALTAFKEKMRTRPGFGASSDIASVKDKLKNTTDSVATFNKALSTKPVMGAAQELAAFEAKLKEFSQNIGMHIAPIYITLNNVKDAMTGLSTVLNNVQQPTWVEPFTKSMGKVVSVLKAIAREYKAVKKEIEAPINTGGGGAARELKFTEAAAASMSKGVRTFYRHVRQELKETRATATETSKAIRDAMAMIQGGGAAGGAGGSSAAGGQRLGFGEQLWSRMRSNMYSYLTMWFGVAGAIRAANAVLELHNDLLEQGNQLSNTKFDYLGQLRLKAGANAPEYEAMAERVMKKGMEKNAAYQFAGFAAMSNISAKEAESIAPYFINNIASANDQRALLSAVAYARANGYSDYSTEQIMAMFLEANKNNPSELAPTANAFVRNLRTNRLFGMSLEEQMALVSLGGAEQKDANAATIQRALLSRIYSEGLAPMILGEFEGKGYYKDEATGRYKFKDEARQAQYEEDMRNGNQVLTVEMIAQMADKMGDSFSKLIGKRLQANLGASFYADISQDPTKFNEIYASMQAIGGGDLTAARSVLNSVSSDQSVMTKVVATAAANQAAIATESRSNFFTTLKALQQTYATAGDGYGYNSVSGFFRGINDWLDNSLPTQAAAVNAQTQRLATIMNDPNVSDEVKQRFKAQYDLLIANYVKEHLPAGEYSTREEQVAAIEDVLDALDDSMSNWRGAGEYNLRWALRDMGGGMARRTADMIFGKPIEDTKPVTGAVKAVRSAAGATTTNKWEEEETARKQAEKEAKQADKEAKQADRDAKRKDAEEKQARKNFLNSLPKAALSAPANAVIENALGVALTDTNADLQQMRDVALNSDISGRTGGNILGKAFYAYASDKTDAKADKEIVNQLVASLNEQGFSLAGMKNIAQAFAQEGMVEGSPGWTAENAKKYEKFFTDIRDYLEAISKGTAEMATVRKFPKRSTPKSPKK